MLKFVIPHLTHATKYTIDMSDTVNVGLGTAAATETLQPETLPLPRTSSISDSSANSENSLSAREGQEPAGVSPKVNSSSDLPDCAKDPCQCLHTVGLLMTGLEARSLLVDSDTLDSKLASQRVFLSRCNSVLGCEACSARPEYLMLLGLLTQNLTNFCEATVDKYLDEVRSHSKTPGTIRSPSSSESSNRANLGSYEVESSEEWSTLMKVLIILQLQSLQTLLRGMKKASHLESNAMLPKVEWPCPTERRVVALVQRLGQAA